MIELICSAIFLTNELIFAEQLQLNDLVRLLSVLDEVLVATFHRFEGIRINLLARDFLLLVWQAHLDRLLEFSISHYVDLVCALAFFIQKLVHDHLDGHELVNYLPQVSVRE